MRSKVLMFLALFGFGIPVYGSPDPTVSPAPSPGSSPIKIEPAYDFNEAVTGIVDNADALFAQIGPIVLTVVGFGILIGFIKLVRQR